MSTYNWTGSFSAIFGSGSWFIAANWDAIFSIPGSSDDVNIGQTAQGGVDPIIAGSGNVANANTVDISAGGTLTVNASGQLDVTTSITVGLEAGSALIVNGGGEVYSGAATANTGSLSLIGSGELIIGGAASAKAWGNGFFGLSLSMGSSSRIVFNTTDTVVFSSNITGGGTLIQEGVGTTVKLTGANSYTGTTQINSGATLQIGDFTGDAITTGSLGTGAVTDNGVLAFDNNNLSTVRGVVSGGGSLHIEVGEVELLADDTITGGATVDAGARLDIGIGTTNGLLANSAITDNGIVAFDLDYDALIGKSISGTGAVYQFSGGIVLDGNDTYSGGTFIASGGTITVGDNDASGGLGSGGVADSGTLAFDRTDSLTVSGVISGTGVVNQNGSGTTILTGADTYTGKTTISAGALQIGSSAATGALASGMIVDNATLAFAGGGRLVVAGNISGIGILIEEGTGITVLTGANSYATTVVNSGSLAVGNDGTTGSLGTGLVIDNGDLDFSRSDATTVGNLIVGAGAVDQFFGTTTLTAANLYTGATEAHSGVLKGGATDAISQLSASVTVDAGAKLDLDGFSESLNNVQGAGAIDNSGAAAVTLAASYSTAATFSGVIGNTGGALTLTKNGTATLTLTGNNTYTGATNINAGTLQVGAGGSTGSLGSGDVVDNGTLTFDRGFTFGNAISGTGAVNALAGTLTLTGANSYSGATTIALGAVLTIATGGALGNGAGAVTDSGALFFTQSGSSTVGNAISGAGILAQNGSGKTILSGADTYTGATSVNSGTLTAGASNAFSANSEISVASGATLDLGGFSQTIASLLGGGTINNSAASAATLTDTLGSQNLTVTGLIEDTGGALSFTKNGTGTLFLAGANSYEGATTVNAGVLTAGSATAFGTNSAVTVASGATLNLQGHSESVGSIAGAGTIENFAGAGAATLTLTSAGETVFSGVIEDNGSQVSLTLNADAHLILTGANTYSGATTIAGELDVGNGGLTGALGTGSVVDNGVLAFAAGGASTIANAISGTGSVQFFLNTTANLTRANTYSGGTVINNATAQAGVVNAFGSGGVSVVNGATLDIHGFNQSLGALSGTGTVANFGSTAATLTENNAAVSIFSGALEDGSSPLKLVKTGAGTLTLSGADTYSNGTSVQLGTLKAGSANAFGTGLISVTAGATLDLGGFGETAAITNAGTVASLTGAATLSGALTNNATLSAAGGALTFTKAVTGTGSAKISGGGALTFKAAFGQSVTFSGAGSLTLAANDPGAVTGFGVGDTIDFANVAFSASDFVTFLGNSARTGGTVTVDNSSGTALASFTVAGAYTPSQFKLSDVGGHLSVVGAKGLARSTADDFNGDGVSDILWRDTTTGADVIWDMTPSGGHAAVNPGTVATNFQVAGIGDFNGDGIADILWRDTTAGADSIWDMTASGGHTTVNPGTVSTSFQVAGVGDFNGDGVSDILWRETATGSDSIWDLTPSGGRTAINPGTVATNFHVAGVGDFNGDGVADILWRDTTSGADAIWDMNPSGGHIAVNPGTVASSFQVAGVGDFNGDGVSDILWRNSSTGADSIWDMSPSGGRTAINPGTVATNWQVATIGDFNHDGIADIFWRDMVTGADSIWEMNASGGHIAVNPGTVASNFKLAS